MVLGAHLPDIVDIPEEVFELARNPDRAALALVEYDDGIDMADGDGRVYHLGGEYYV